MDTSLSELSRISAEIARTYAAYGDINRIGVENLPSRERIIATLQDLLTLLFPGYVGQQVPSKHEMPFFVNGLVNSAYVVLQEEIARSLNYECERSGRCDVKTCEEMGEEIALGLLMNIPSLRETLHLDVQAAYDGDPQSLHR